MRLVEQLCRSCPVLGLVFRVCSNATVYFLKAPDSHVGVIHEAHLNTLARLTTPFIAKPHFSSLALQRTADITQADIPLITSQLFEHQNAWPFGYGRLLASYGRKSPKYQQSGYKMVDFAKLSTVWRQVCPSVGRRRPRDISGIVHTCRKRQGCQPLPNYLTLTRSNR